MSEVVPRQGFITIDWKLSILEHFKNCRFLACFVCQALCAREFCMKELSWGCEIVYRYKPKLSILEPLQIGDYLIFSWGNVGYNIRYNHLNMCVWGRKSLYAGMSLLVAKQVFNLIKVSSRPFNHLFPRSFFNDGTGCRWIKLELKYR